MNKDDSATNNQKIVQLRAVDVLFNNIVIDYKVLSGRYQVFAGIKSENDYLLAVQLSERFKKQGDDIAVLGIVLDYQIAMYKNIAKK